MKNIYQLFLFLLITPAITLYSGNKNIEKKHSIYEVIAQSVVQKNKEALLNQKKQIKKSITFFKEVIKDKDKAIFREKNGKITDLTKELDNYCIIKFSELEEIVFFIWLYQKIFECISDSISKRYIELKQSTETINNEVILKFKIVYKTVSDDEFVKFDDAINSKGSVILEEIVNLYTAILDLL